VEDGGVEDLEARKVYQVLPDRDASHEGCVRIIDESGEDYVYPGDLLVPVKLPAAVVRPFKKRTETKGSNGRHSILCPTWWNLLWPWRTSEDARLMSTT
jgi:hypothetical protein